MKTVHFCSCYQWLIALALVIPLGCGPLEVEDEALYATDTTGGKADSFSSLPAADATGGIAAVKSWAAARIKTAESAFAASGGKRFGSPTTWADEVVYQIQVDRFNDGDPTNNGKNVSDYQYQHRYKDQVGLAEYHHGGDLKGITDRLDYLATLGVTSLWITPVFKTIGSYHGYCTSDFTEIDPNFGSAETLRTLVAEAHKRNIRVVLDIVVNHMCSKDSGYDDKATPFQDWAYGQCVDDFNWKRWNGGSSIRGQRTLNFGATFFPPFRNKNFFNRCGYKAGDASSHGNGAIFGDFSNQMLDFDTMNWDFQDIFTELHKYWIAYADIDGFRVDAAKHVTEDFMAKLSTDVRAYAKSLGKINFLLVGEVAASTYEQALRVGKMRANVSNPSDTSAVIPATLRSRLVNLKSTYLANAYFPYPGLNSVYDFGHSGSVVDVMHNYRAPMDIKNWFWAGGETDSSQCSASFCELSANGDPQTNWNVIEIHDWPRFAMTGRNQAQLSASLGYLLATQGTPVLYYGVEQGFDGTCPWNSIVAGTSAAYDDVKAMCNGKGDARYRQDMFVMGPWRLRSLISSVDALAHIGFDNKSAPASWKTDPYLSTSHSHFGYIKRLIAVRKSCPTLRRGQIYFRAAHSSTSGGLLAFSRIYQGKEMLVIVNTSGASIPVTALAIDASLNWGKDYTPWKNLLNGYQTASVGKLGQGMGLYFSTGFAVPGRGVALFAPESHLTGYNTTAAAHLCK